MQGDNITILVCHFILTKKNLIWLASFTTI